MLQLDRQGWLHPHATVLLAPSPNHDNRPASVQPYLLVVHNISLPPNQFQGDAVIQFFQNQLDFTQHPWFENIRDVTVSAHFLYVETATWCNLFLPNTVLGTPVYRHLMA